MANNPTALDFNDLIYYDKKIKQYVDDKADFVAANSYTKDEIDAKIKNVTIDPTIIQGLSNDIAVLKDDRDEAEADIQRIEATLVEITDLLGNHTTDLTALKKEVNELEVANITITNKIADLQASIPSIEGLASEEYVRAAIAEAELADKDIDLSDYYTKRETELVIDAAISKIPQVDLSGYATKEEVVQAREQSARNEVKILAIDSELFDIKKELETIPTKTSQLENDSGFITAIPSEYITETELDSKGYITEHQSLENYATKEFVEESIDNIVIPDVSNFATVEYVTNNYITNTQAESFATHEELETAVTEIVDEHFEETVITHVDEEIDKKIAEIQTINYGTFGEV